MRLPALLVCAALSVAGLCTESFAQSVSNTGNNGSGNNTTISDKVTDGYRIFNGVIELR